MKHYLFFKKIACIAAILLFGTEVAHVRAADAPEIVVNYIPPVGSEGRAEGRVIWDALSAANAGQYAVIAMLRTQWGDFVKPTFENYLNVVDESGNFSIDITTGGANDYSVVEVSFYFVLRQTFSGVSGNSVQASAMGGKYLGQPLTVNRINFWANRPQPPVASLRPGFVTAGAKVTLSCETGGNIRYTLDGSDPASSASALTYSGGAAFSVPADRPLLLKAVTSISGAYSAPASFAWLPQEPLTTPFFGLNVSLALNGETFGQFLSEDNTRERMAPVAKYTKWVRTFGTLNNGLPYINKIAKELGMKTMIGVYVTSAASGNNAQIQGLRNILQSGAAPDLIAVGNECSLAGVSPATLVSCIDAVRRLLKEYRLVIPVGSVDVANASWSQSVVDKLDFIGINTYPGTWDATPENEMIPVLKRTYANALASFPSKLILITETGTPHAGGAYIPPGTNATQTPSPQKASKYLYSVKEWCRNENIPAFYFEAYDERCKSLGEGHPVEQYFGIMNGNGQEHSWVHNALLPNLSTDVTPYPNPSTGMFYFGRECAVKVYSANGALLQESFGDRIDLSLYAQGLYLLQIDGGAFAKVIKK